MHNSPEDGGFCVKLINDLIIYDLSKTDMKVNINLCLRPATVHPLKQSDLLQRFRVLRFLQFFENHILAIFSKFIQFGTLEDIVVDRHPGAPNFPKSHVFRLKAWFSSKKLKCEISWTNPKGLAWQKLLNWTLISKNAQFRGVRHTHTFSGLNGWNKMIMALPASQISGSNFRSTLLILHGLFRTVRSARRDLFIKVDGRQNESGKSILLGENETASDSFAINCKSVHRLRSDGSNALSCSAAFCPARRCVRQVHVLQGLFEFFKSGHCCGFGRQMNIG